MHCRSTQGYRSMGLYLVLTLAAIVGILWFTVNRLAALDSRCDRAVADIDVQLKHRHGLLPNLLESVRAFATHELAAIEMVTRARSEALGASSGEARMRAEAVLSAQVAQLVGVAEAYPELRASVHFQGLRDEVAGAENKIAASRRYLNAAVDEYNATLRQFPASLLARVFNNYRRRSFYDIGIERALLDDAPALKF
jgi:LemA protein